MISPEALGALVVGAPAVLAAYVTLWRRQRPVFWFVIALIAAGLGYLFSTGALTDIGGVALGALP